jgi:hypothetical protein
VYNICKDYFLDIFTYEKKKIAFKIILDQEEGPQNKHAAKKNPYEK